MIKAVFFDLDGTLVNTIADLGGTVDQLLSEWGIVSPYQEADYKQMVGDGARVLLRRAFYGVHAALNEADEETAVSRFKTLYSRAQFNHTTPYDEILKLLKQLKQQGLFLAVITNKPNENAQQMVNHYFSCGCFDFIAGQREGVPIKPNPSQVFAAMQHLAVAQDEVVYVGDSNTDVQTAIRAGILSIGAAWGFRGEEELKREGANYVAGHPLEVLKIIEKLP